MENASKALVMAGGVLISIIIISMLMLVINNLTNYQEANTTMDKSNKIAQFNNEYLPYDKDDIRGNELVTLANKVLDYNIRRTQYGSTKTYNTDEYEYGGDGLSPLTLIVKFDTSGKKSATTFNYRDDLPTDCKLFDSSTSYEISQARQTFKTKILDPIVEMKTAYPNEQVLEELSNGISKIFYDQIADYSIEEKLKDAVDNVNYIFGTQLLKYDTPANINMAKQALSSNAITLPSVKSRFLRKDTYKYYAYRQFKRGRFKRSEDFTYDSEGRITKMVFEFTGDIS
ncbi:MAG: hypothetical protein J6I85_01535 [Clostridia bacterium]|nr:hypothetical protein [Clostridia bacterium]